MILEMKQMFIYFFELLFYFIQTGFVKKVEECHHARELSNHAEKKIVNLRREITGYDEREIMFVLSHIQSDISNAWLE